MDTGLWPLVARSSIPMLVGGPATGRKGKGRLGYSLWGAVAGAGKVKRRGLSYLVAAKP